MNRKQKIDEYKKVKIQLLTIKENMNKDLIKIKNEQGSFNEYEL